MTRKLINAALALAVAAPLPALAQQRPARKAAAPSAAEKAPARPQAKPGADPAFAAWAAAEQANIRKGTIEVVTPVSGISTAQDTYDVLAPFDGRVEEVQAEMFGYVDKKSVLARLVSTEMAALLDSSSDESRKQTERRWQDVYSYTELKPDTEGVVTNVYVQPRGRIAKGDRLFTVAQKVVVVGRNTEPLHSKLGPGMTAKLRHKRTEIVFNARLANFIKLKGSDLQNRVWLELTDLRQGIRIGEQFDGTLTVGKSEGTMLVPRRHVINSGGRRFLVTEIMPGLETDEDTEVLGHSSIYLAPPFDVLGEGKDGKKPESR